MTPSLVYPLLAGFVGILAMGFGLWRGLAIIVAVAATLGGVWLIGVALL